MYVENVPTVVCACCTLHNICKIHGDAFNDEWLEDANDTAISSEEDSSTEGRNDESTRDALVHYFTTHPL